MSVLPGEAVARFQQLLVRTEQLHLREPMAVVLATADTDGRPTARVVLLRGFDETGFVVFTNTRSTKGQQIAANPYVALCFYFDELAEQVRVEGVARLVTPQEADQYWKSRHRDSQLGAWASDQSQQLPDRATLEARFDEYRQRFAGQDVPRPPHWSGYRIAASRIEFWSSRPARLHERISYELRDGQWRKVLLYP
jgi:pyridoxamine 5'-phosphate oxidase